MDRVTYGTAARVALAVVFVSGFLLTPLTATSGQGTPPVAPPASAGHGPERLHLVQAVDPAAATATYAPEQADRGATRYQRECAECHGDDLRGGLNGGPPLRGLAFGEKFFDGLPASVLFAYMSSAMPPNSPGRYSPSSYADLMALILQHNGFSEGDPLPSDLNELDQILLVN